MNNKTEPESFSILFSDFLKKEKWLTQRFTHNLPDLVMMPLLTQEIRDKWDPTACTELGDGQSECNK